jgi:hypothetical protein
MSDAQVAQSLRDASKEIEEICNKSDSQSKFYRYGMIWRVFFIPILRVFFIGSIGYDRCISHYFQSSCEVAYLAVEPGNVPDLIKIVSQIFSLVVDN